MKVDGPRSDDRALTILVIPAGSSQESRSVRVTYGRLRRWAWVLGGATVVLALMFGSWWYFAARSLRVAELEAEVERYVGDRERLEILAGQLEQLEADYTQIREMFGSEGADLPTNLWLPPAGGTGSRAGSSDAFLPTSWPLTERGFVTQGLLEGGQNHPGIDVAVAADSYVRAAGAGTVLEAGQDPTYGNYVIIDHGQGYRTLYGHASVLFVTPGITVRQNEVIALSGSTGRSTAPHLHFEILRDGQAIDPLDMVVQP